jgi:isoleucyl-tRNA synthetase
VGARSEIDRWVIGELYRTVEEVIERMDAYDNYNACNRLSAFVDALSNWYVRRNRDRFWSGDEQSQSTSGTPTGRSTNAC